MRTFAAFLRYLQLLLDKTLCLIVLLVGAAILAWFHSTLPTSADPYITEHAPGLHDWLPDPNDLAVSQAYTILGVILLIIGLLTFLPRLPKMAKRIIKFQADKGDVDVNLKAVQDTINRVMNALPEVKTIRIQVIPTRDKKRISLKADAILIKDVGRSARGVAEHVKKSMHAAAANLLGGDMVVRSELYVDSVILARNTNMVDIAAFPAEDTSNYLTDQSGNTWDSGASAAGPSYIPDTDAYSSGATAEADKLDGVELPEVKEPPRPSNVESTAYSAERDEDLPTALMDEDAEVGPGYPREPDQSSFEVPRERRDPVDSIDQIIMADNGDADDESNEQPMMLDEEEDDKSQRGY
jgi:hypothetical protein